MIKTKMGVKYGASSLLVKISTLVTVLCLIIMGYSSYSLYLGWTDYQQARELIAVENITKPFTAALKDFMFERGRTNVVLSAKGTISEDNRSFINNRRSAADEFFETAFALMGEKYPEGESLRKEYNNIKKMRIQVDEEAQKPIQQREPKVRTQWFESCTDYINLVISTLKTLSGNQPKNNLSSSHINLIMATLHFRSVVGNESSLLTSVITSGETMDNNEFAAFMRLRGESKQVWADIQKEIAIIGSEPLKTAANTVYDKYYLKFRPIQDLLLVQMQKGRISEDVAKQIAGLSVPALDSILLLADAADKEIDIENKANMRAGHRSFVLGIVQLTASILLIIFIPSYLKRKLVQPLHSLVEMIEKLSFGRTDTSVPFLERKDEIGKLANGVDMLQKSIGEEQNLKQELQETVMKLEELSIKDSLTGIYNRRYIVDKIDELEKRYKRNKSVFSIIMSDIDNFKKTNDSYGHDCGDKVLSFTANLIIGCCREQDIPARWGGEEFLILLPDTDIKGARILAERMKRELETQSFKYKDTIIKITMTFGISEYSETIGREGIINNADKALYQGKNSGRNKVVCGN